MNGFHFTPLVFVVFLLLSQGRDRSEVGSEMFIGGGFIKGVAFLFASAFSAGLLKKRKLINNFYWRPS